MSGLISAAFIYMFCIYYAPLKLALESVHIIKFLFHIARKEINCMKMVKPLKRINL